MNEKVAGFDSRLKYYDFVYDLIRQSIYFLNMEDYDKSLQNIKIWKGILPFKKKKDSKDSDVDVQYNLLIKKCDNEIRRKGRRLATTKRGDEKIRLTIIQLHELLNTFMHNKNMHIPTKIDYDPGTIVENVIYD